MTYTAPTSPAVGDQITAAQGAIIAADIIDINGRFLGGQWQQTTLQAIAANTQTTLTNYTADFADAAFNTTTGVYTCPVAGIYEAWGVVSLVAGAARNAAIIIQNATTVTQVNIGSGSALVTPSIPPFRMTCALNDTIALQAFVTTGVNTGAGAGGRSVFCVRRIG